MDKLPKTHNGQRRCPRGQYRVQIRSKRCGIEWHTRTSALHLRCIHATLTEAIVTLNQSHDWQPLETYQVLTLANSKVHVFTALPQKGWTEGFTEEPTGPKNFMYKVVRMSDVTISLNRFKRVDEDGNTGRLGHEYLTLL